MAVGFRFDCSRPLRDALSRVTLGESPKPGPREVSVQVLAAPVNNADLAVIKGTYPIKQVDVFPGIEGIGVVESCGDEVEGLMPGDYVVPTLSSLGMWRKHICCPATQVTALPAPRFVIEEIIREHGLGALASLNSSAATAYRFLCDSSCAAVLQTSANSFLGRIVIQLAKTWGIRTVNLVRTIDCKPELLALGADCVFTYEELNGEAVRKALDGQLPDKALCTVGAAAKKAAAALRPGGELIVISCVDGHPVELDFGELVFRGISVKGFWMSQWYQQCLNDVSMQSCRRQMLAELLTLYSQGMLSVPAHKYLPAEEVNIDCILAATSYKKMLKFA